MRMPRSYRACKPSQTVGAREESEFFRVHPEDFQGASYEMRSFLRLSAHVVLARRMLVIREVRELSDVRAPLPWMNANSDLPQS